MVKQPHKMLINSNLTFHNPSPFPLQNRVIAEFNTFTLNFLQWLPVTSQS
jgi:hypothetical protein